MNIARMAFAIVAGVVLGGCATTKLDREVSNLKSQLHEQEARCTKSEARDGTKIDYLTKTNQQLSTDLQDEIKKGLVIINQQKDQLTLSVMQEVLFDSGRAELRESGKPVLEKVARAILGLSGQLVTIEGHTDNVPIGSSIIGRYPTNWELSTARSTTVVRFLQDRGVDPQELGAAGFGEYRPVATNDTPEGRQHNRRIDVVLAPSADPKHGSLAASQ